MAIFSHSDAGGYVVASGTPEEIIKVKEWHTGRHLREHLACPNGHKSSESERSYRTLGQALEIIHVAESPFARHHA